MKVSELAKEFKTTTAYVLEKLKSLKLKAKDGNQELSKALLIVLKSELIKDMKVASREKIKKKVAKKPAAKKKVAEDVEDAVDDSDTKGKTSKKTKKEEKYSDVKGVKKEEKEATEEKEVKATAKKSTKKEDEKALEEGKAAKKKAEEKTNSRTPKIKYLKDVKVGVVRKNVDVKDDKSAKKEKKNVKVDKNAPKTPEAYKGKLDFKVGEAAPKEVRKKFEKGKRLKHKTSIAQPFIPLKPFNKKKKRMRVHDGGVARQPGVENIDLPVPVSDEELKPLELRVPITVKDFANCIDQKSGVVFQTLMQMKIFANINQGLDEDVVQELAKKFGYEYVQIKSQEEQLVEIHQEEDDDPSKLTPRAPVVTFMGHVDHGKTSLLDCIRKSKIVDQEHGGITQHIGAYSVEIEKGRITFLDTPGHEAFTAMRSRGAHITDIVVLVVAADEGIMPQTQEAINHAQAAGVAIIVALNKIDRPGANLDRIKQQLSEKGLASEDWGGKTTVVPVSAMTGEGIDDLLEMIILESEMLELKANKEKKASGTIVEAHLSQGRGAESSIIVQSGTLYLNDFIVVGMHYGKVKAMFDDHGKRVKSAGPSTPVGILGLDGVPEAGSTFYVVKDEREAREITNKRRLIMKDARFGASKRITLEDLYSQIQDGTVRELNVILKADVQGSLEALRDSLAKIPSEEVKVRFIHMGVGDINASDIILAVASNAIILAFHVGVGPRAAQELEKQPVDVRQYRIIYDAVDDVKKSLSGLLAPKIKRTFLARIEVRQVFNLSRSGFVAGCFVVKGKAKRKDRVEVHRNGEVVYDGCIASLKRFKDDVKDVAEGYECGLTLDNYDELLEGDSIEAYHLEEIARSI